MNKNVNDITPFNNSLLMGKDDAWIALGALILGALLLKAVFDPNTQIYRCPTCNLVIHKNTHICPRCSTPLSWNQGDKV